MRISSDADIAYGVLRCVNLRNGNLRNANLQNTELEGSNLSGANLCGANFRDADLKNVKLIGADLFCTNFTRANLNGVDFSKALHRGRDINFKGAKIKGVEINWMLSTPVDSQGNCMDLWFAGKEIVFVTCDQHLHLSLKEARVHYTNPKYHPDKQAARDRVQLIDSLIEQIQKDRWPYFQKGKP